MQCRFGEVDSQLNDNKDINQLKKQLAEISAKIPAEPTEKDTDLLYYKGLIEDRLSKIDPKEEKMQVGSRWCDKSYTSFEKAVTLKRAQLRTQLKTCQFLKFDSEKLKTLLKELSAAIDFEPTGPITDPGEMELYFFRGLIHRKLNDRQEARQDLDLYVRSNHIYLIELSAEDQGMAHLLEAVDLKTSLMDGLDSKGNSNLDIDKKAF